MGNKNSVRINKPVNVRNEHTTLWNGNRITVKRLLAVEEFSEAVFAIVSKCIDDDRRRVYVEMFNIAFMSTVITSYTNVELPTDINDINYLLYETNLYDVVEGLANKKQIADIMNCARVLIGV